MILYKAPEPPVFDDRPSVFLAGTIDNGESENWQQKFEFELIDLDVIVLNPRREVWAPQELQSIQNKTFKQQVEWELNGLEKCIVIVMCFLANSKSPITLLELGLAAASRKLIVCCEDKFWRKGNIEIVCDKFDIPLHNNMDSTLSDVRNRLLRLSAK